MDYSGRQQQYKGKNYKKRETPKSKYSKQERLNEMRGLNEGMMLNPVVPLGRPLIPEYLKGFVRTEGNFGNFEKKWLDTLINGANIPSGGAIMNSCLNVIPQGTTQNTRVGLKVNVKSLYAKFFIDWSVTVPNVVNNNMARVLLVLDTQANGAAIANFTDVLSVALPTSFNNLTNSTRFRILKDWFVPQPVGAWNGVDVLSPPSILECYLKFKDGIPIIFSSTTGAITEVRSNNLALIGVGYNNDATLFGYTRIRYTDN